MSRRSVPLSAPLAARGPDAPWSRVRDQLESRGTVVVYGLLPDWLAVHWEPARLRPLLGQDWARYEKMRPALRKRFVASRLLLRYSAAAVIDTAPDLMDLAYQPGGRPYIRGCDQIDISLSHTEEVMVVGITRRGRIGVDVERADRQLAGTGSELQTCTPYEQVLLDAAQGRRRNDILLRLWTLKEAYSKALGQGLRFRFTEFGFSLSGTSARLAKPDGAPTGGTEWTFGTFAAEGKYVVSAALYDAGFGDTADLAVGTALDEGLLDTLLDAVADPSGDPAGVLGKPDGVDPVTGVQLGDDRGEVVPDRAL